MVFFSFSTRVQWLIEVVLLWVLPQFYEAQRTTSETYGKLMHLKFYTFYELERLSIKYLDWSEVFGQYNEKRLYISPLNYVHWLHSELIKYSTTFNVSLLDSQVQLYSSHMPIDISITSYDPILDFRFLFPLSRCLFFPLFDIFYCKCIL